MKLKIISLALVLICLVGCSASPDKNSTEKQTTAQTKVSTTIKQTTTEKTTKTTTQTTTEATTLPKEDRDFVKIKDYIPDIYIELKYATTDNFTKKVVYDFDEAWLRYGTVKKLAEVQKELKAKGYSLKIWDAFRPVSAQFKLWEAYPDSTYVANPNSGYSSHSYGNTVDITLVNADGTEVKMPTGFDDFSTLADRNYSDCDKEAAENAELLEDTMEAHGFSPYYSEWWHYSDNANSFGVDESFEIEKQN